MNDPSFPFLTNADRELLFGRARKASYRRGGVIFREGEPQRNLYFVRKGLVRVERAYHGQGIAVARYGIGEVFGETSFVEEREALGSIVAEEDVEVDVLEGVYVHSLLTTDAAFASRFFQSLAFCLGERLHRVWPATLPPSGGTDAGVEWVPRTGQISERQIPEELVAAVDAFKTELRGVSEELKEGQLNLPEAAPLVSRSCDDLMTALEKHTQSEALVGIGYDDLLAFRDLSHLERGVGGYVFRETFAFFMRSATIARCFEKPRGYAEDREMLAMIDHNEPDGDGFLGPLIDCWFLARPLCRALRHDRRAMSALLREESKATPSGPMRITSLSAGTAEELFDLLLTEQPANLYATCVDSDADALLLNARLAEQAGCGHCLTFLHANLSALVRGEGAVSLGAQRVIYGLGVCDYLDDAQVRALLDWMHAHLAEGGLAVLTNRDAGNPDRTFMEHILDWPVVHRDAEQLRALFTASRFGGLPLDIRREDAGVNLHAICRKS